MTYKSNIQNTRKKFLQQKPLSDVENDILEKDFGRKDYVYYKTITDEEILLSGQYTADATWPRIEQAIKPKKIYHSLIKYAAAITVLIIVASGIYHLNKIPENVYVSTSYGERKQITLPDGSTVILNSLSSVSYPENIHKGKKREIKLDGEAYFDVAKDRKKPFIVKASEIDIRVLGTKFNVSAYKNDEYIITSLYEGAVAITFGAENSIQLKPDKQAVYHKKTDTIELSEITDENQSAWISDSMYFENIPLKDIFKILERERDITFSVSAEINKELKLTAKFNKNESVEEILEYLSQSGNFTFEKKDNSFLINKQKH